MFEPDVSGENSLRSALLKAAAEAEDSHQVPVELVTVGDVELDDGMRALVAAAREAIFNAVRHSGAPRVDVYVEVDTEHVEVFVRDRGRGFDVSTVADDRLGVRRSIIDRMERHGGVAEIRSGDGNGTEVRIGLSIRSSNGSS